MPYYAVARGRNPGIYSTWDACKAEVERFTDASFKKFKDPGAAAEFILANQAKAKLAVVNAAIKDIAAVPGFMSFTDDTNRSLTAATRLNPLPSSRKLPVAPGPAWRSTQYNTVTPYSRQQTSPTSLSGIPSTIGSNPRKRAIQIPIQQVPSMFISTTTANFKRQLKITEGTVTGWKKAVDGKPITFNDGVNLSQYTVDVEGYVIVYTDGACSKNGQNEAKAGIGAWFGDYHPLNVSEPVRGKRHTNNTAEIQAIERAILKAKQVGIDKLCVMTDSQFTINCITRWLPGWIRSKWRLKNGQPVKNKDDLEKLITVSKGVQIKWVHVRGHQGIHGNEQADRLAVEGAQSSSKL